LLQFSSGAFSRSTPATFEPAPGQLETARANELRWVEVNGIRMALFEGASKNWLRRTTEFDHQPEWAPSDSQPMNVVADSEPAPDGMTTADRLASPGAPGRGPGQNVSLSAGRWTLSTYARSASDDFPGLQMMRAFVTDTALSTLSTETWRISADWDRVALPITTTTTALASVGISHASGWPSPNTEALIAPDVALWGMQLEERPFPTSYIPTSSESALRSADTLIIASPPPWIYQGMWQVDVRPLFSSAELIANWQHTLFSFGAAAAISLEAGAEGRAKIRIQSQSNIFRSPDLTWTRGDVLRLTFDMSSKTVTISGADQGDGSYTFAPVAFPIGPMRVGSAAAPGAEAFAAMSELRQVSAPTEKCTQDPSCTCGDGVLDEHEECDPALDVRCSEECAWESWIDECPYCRNGQVCPSQPNGAAFGQDPSVRICVPSAVDCAVACGDSYDAPCGKCIKQPDCSAASCGSATDDGTGHLCTQVCPPGTYGCLLDSDCGEGTHCIQDETGRSQCSAPLTTGGVADKYLEPGTDADGKLCFLGPLCESCAATCSGRCNLIGECLPQGPACPEQCTSGCDPQGTCLVEAPPEWPLGEPILPSDVVPPPAGMLTVSDSGVASYSIPLTLPDGVSGHRPELSFEYNSRAGDGALGRGWSLGGMSAISVCEASPRVTSVYRGGPSLCLDGEPLLVKQPSGDRARNGVTYFTGLYENGYVVKGQWDKVDGKDNPFPSVGDGLKPHTWVPGREFTVHHEDGRTLYYGHASDDAFLLRGGHDPAMGPSSIRQWLLRRQTDRFGNTVEYRYQKARVGGAEAEAILRWIGYNGGSSEIALHYVGDDKQEGCADPLDPYCQLATDLQHFGRWQGGPFGHLMVLSRVDVRVSAQPVRSYSMGYEATELGGIRFLKTLQECGYAQGKRSCAPPLEFDYGNSNNSELLAHNPNGRTYNSSSKNVEAFLNYTKLHNLVFDANGDGRDDYVTPGDTGELLANTADTLQDF
jgi:hypothetical protein